MDKLNTCFGFRMLNGVIDKNNNRPCTEGLEKIIPAPEFGGSFIHPGNRRAWGSELSYQF